jgi:hypothetical protein
MRRDVPRHHFLIWCYVTRKFLFYRKGNFQLTQLLLLYYDRTEIYELFRLYFKPFSALFLNNQPDAPIIQIYSVIKFCLFRASSLPIIRSSLLYIRHW